MDKLTLGIDSLDNRKPLTAKPLLKLEIAKDIANRNVDTDFVKLSHHDLLRGFFAYRRDEGHPVPERMEEDAAIEHIVDIKTVGLDALNDTGGAELNSAAGPVNIDPNLAAVVRLDIALLQRQIGVDHFLCGVVFLANS
jgi:hypothetical protein